MSLRTIDRRIKKHQAQPGRQRITGIDIICPHTGDVFERWELVNGTYKHFHLIGGEWIEEIPQWMLEEQGQL